MAVQDAQDSLELDDTQQTGEGTGATEGVERATQDDAGGDAEQPSAEDTYFNELTNELAFSEGAGTQPTQQPAAKGEPSTGSSKESASGDDPLSELPSDAEIESLRGEYGDATTKLIGSLVKGIKQRDTVLQRLSKLAGIEQHLPLIEEVGKMRPLFAGMADLAVDYQNNTQREVNRGLDTIAKSGGANIVGRNAAERQANPMFQRNIDRILSAAGRARAIAAKNGVKKAVGDLVFDAYCAQMEKAGRPVSGRKPQTKQQQDGGDQETAARAQARRANPASGVRGGAPAGKQGQPATGRAAAEAKIGAFLAGRS